MISYTIYRGPLLSKTRVGISFVPTPSIGISELRHLILTLQKVEKEMVHALCLELDV